MAAAHSPARRVLGDKTPNASVKRHGRESIPKQQFDDLMRDEPVTSIGRAPDMRAIIKVTHRAGQKRRIEEVDGAQEQEQDQPGRDRAGSTSPFTAVPTESNSEADERDPLLESQTETTTSTLVTSFPASQEHLVPVEEQFDIQEEMSQQTLEQIHATPIQSNISQPRPPLQPTLMTETSQDSMRMSSFIDFASQDSGKDDLDMISTDPPVTAESRLAKAIVDEKAETLRTRLQLALYKVQTNQIGQPFSKLKQPRPPSSSSSSPELPPQPPSLRRTSPEGIVAAARARATQQKKPAVRSLNSLPIPTILPTAYSARCPPHGQENESRLSLPSSNRIETASAEAARRTDSQSRTPTSSQKIHKAVPKTPMQLSSPRRKDVDGPCTDTEHGHRAKGFGGLTSSVVKGEAANGLLELMRAAAA